MDVALFGQWLAGIALLDPAQRGRALKELALAEANDPEGCLTDQMAAPLARDAVETRVPARSGATIDAASGQNLLAKIGQNRIASFGCPHCGNDAIHAWGQSRGKPRYRCTHCRKSFNPLTGTPLAGLHKQGRWRDQAQALMNGETVAKAAVRCQVDYTTAFRWRHRFLAALNLDHPGDCRGSSRRMKPLFWNPSRASAAACQEPRASAEARPASGVCRRSRSRSSWRVTAPVPPPMPSCRASTLPASRWPWAKSSTPPRTSAAMAAQPSRPSHGAPK